MGMASVVVLYMLNFSENSAALLLLFLLIGLKVLINDCHGKQDTCRYKRKVDWTDKTRR